MDHLRFAFCIVFPETTAYDVVNAAMKHSVHILDKEVFDPAKDYSSYRHGITLQNGVQINPLFIFRNNSVLAEDDESFRQAMDCVKEYL